MLASIDNRMLDFIKAQWSPESVYMFLANKHPEGSAMIYTICQPGFNLSVAALQHVTSVLTAY